jgi:hypothetical protein
MSELYDVEVTPLLQNAGEYIGRGVPAEQRVAWMLFLLDQIKPFLTDAEFAAFVAELSAALDRRAAG